MLSLSPGRGRSHVVYESSPLSNRIKQINHHLLISLILLSELQALKFQGMMTFVSSVSLLKDREIC